MKNRPIKLSWKDEREKLEKAEYERMVEEIRKLNFEAGFRLGFNGTHMDISSLDDGLSEGYEAGANLMGKFMDEAYEKQYGKA